MHEEKELQTDPEPDALAPSALPPPDSARPRAKTLGWPLALVAAGVSLITAMALLEDFQLEGQAWRYTVVSRDGEPLWDGTLPIYARKLPAENFPPSPFMEELRKLKGGPELADILGTDMRESVIAIALSPEQWQSLTGSGRQPVPGKHEVLAGQLCRLDRFTIDGAPFEVAGRLPRGAAGLSFSYVVPYDDTVAALFTKEAGATRGWLDPQGLRRPLPDVEKLETQAAEQQIVMPLMPATAPVAWGGFGGILLVVIGGAFVQVRLLQRFNERFPLFRDIIDPISRFPRLFLAVHLLCYGTLMGTSLLAFALPLVNLQVLTFVAEVFTTGGLSKLGEEYLSGNILGATWHTFVNNFVVQTVGTAVVPSLFVPFWGLFKTMLNLAVAGFALAPLWTGLLGRFIYHSITLTLEVEAYVLAAFAVCLYPIYLVRAFQSDVPAEGLMKAGAMLGWGTVLSGVLLFVSAFYEAVTLIIVG